MIRRHILEDCIGVQIHTGDVSRRDVQVKVSGIDTHDERARCTQHIGQCKRAQRDVGAWPMEWENHLQRTD